MIAPWHQWRKRMNAMLQKLAWQKSSCTGTRNQERAREMALWGSVCRASMRRLVHISRTQVSRAAHIYNPRRGCKWEGRQREGGRGGITAKGTREGRRGQGEETEDSWSPVALQFRQIDEIQGQWETLSKNKVRSQWGRSQTMPSSRYMHAQVHICPIHEHT